MSTTIEDLVEQASKLSAEDRTHLADLLLVSVPDDESAEVDASWEEEIRRRVDAVRAGTAQAVSAEDVHAEARAVSAAVRSVRYLEDIREEYLHETTPPKLWQASCFSRPK